MTDAIRAAIVDDEDLGRRKISRMLKEDGEVDIVGEFGGGEETITALRELKPDLLFLDIALPGIDGFTLLRELSTTVTPFVIFVTAFDQHAVHAFQVHAIDYLLKPFDRVRFQDALLRAKEQVRQRRHGSLNQKLMELLNESNHSTPSKERIMVKSSGRISFILFIRPMSRTIPPLRGSTPPVTDVPDPRGVTGMRRLLASLSTFETCSALFGNTMTSGTPLCTDMSRE